MAWRRFYWREESEPLSVEDWISGGLDKRSSGAISPYGGRALRATAAQAFDDVAPPFLRQWQIDERRARDVGRSKWRRLELGVTPDDEINAWSPCDEHEPALCRGLLLCRFQLSLRRASF